MKHFSIILCALLIASAAASKPTNLLDANALSASPDVLLKLLENTVDAAQAVQKKMGKDIDSDQATINKTLAELEKIRRFTDEFGDPRMKRCRDFGQSLYDKATAVFGQFGGCLQQKRDNAHHQIEELFNYVDALYERLATLRNQAHNKCIDETKNLLEVPGAVLCVTSKTVAGLKEIPELLVKTAKASATVALLPPSVAACTAGRALSGYVAALRKSIESLIGCVRAVKEEIKKGFNDAKTTTTSSTTSTTTTTKPPPTDESLFPDLDEIFATPESESRET